jgi:hypothetical protein
MNSSLQTKIIEFMAVINDCLVGTNVAKDRDIYRRDIAIAAQWLIDLNKGVDPEEIVDEIKNSQTDKHFSDYWRQGAWGDMEIKALKRLQKSI